jgi:hypothetical protein
MRAERSRHWALVGLLAGVSGGACGGDDTPAPPMCIDTLPASCAPAFDPTWDEVYKVMVQQSCGGSFGTGCHGPEGRNGNLVLYEKDLAYRALLGMDGTHARVEPNDPACSPLMERLTTDVDERRMPQGIAKLPENVLCGVQKWIEEGANP